MAANPRVVVFGGTGHFGARICRRLAKESGLELIVTSRSGERASEFASGLQDQVATVSGAAVDQNAPGLADRLRDLNPTVVIHTAGPYQGQDYRVAQACIATGSHYVDLADGRHFVAGFDALDAAAKDAGVVLVSGASTLPGISSAVVDQLRGRFQTIERIETSIAPAHQTPRGLGTVRAVLSYCGVPFETWRDGAWRTVHGWQDLRWQRYPSLGRRLSGACDVPDLALFPDYVPGIRTVSFHAALEAPWEQLGLWAMAWLTRVRLVRDWTKFAPRFSAMSERLIRLGSMRGGMHVRIDGTGPDGRPHTCHWYLVAEQNHGPEIPCTPAIVIAKQLLEGRLSEPGAIPCLGLFTVEECMQELSDYDVIDHFLP
jgi:NAD(P)-dependent dehydrogenase (short-subunit alcohol dehydrogenase family)